MNTDERYMQRCLQLAENGRGAVSPNPMVGSVVVHQGKIIGEGYHREYGCPHAEVNAIRSVKDKSLLKEATVYVSLEPCSHHGKTPPCSQLLIDSQVAKVVIACLDPYPAVAGRGVQMLKDAGIDVQVGVLEKEALALNKEFITVQIKKRPYIYLKWAQSEDGYIDQARTSLQEAPPTIISSSFTKMLVHKLRAEVDAIMVGTNTAIKDNPSLTTRLWYGDNPVRVTLDRTGRIPSNSVLYNGEVKTIFFTQKDDLAESEPKKEQIKIEFVSFDKALLPTLLTKLIGENCNSILVEGGSQLLQSFINQGLWDEAYIEIAPIRFESGITAPRLEGRVKNECNWDTSKHLYLVNA